MAGRTFILAVALVGSACAAEPRYVVRLDLDKIAAATAVREPAPGFATLTR